MYTTCLSETITVEVFKTNVDNRLHAFELVEQINKSFELVSVNFDLEDCDRILRVEGANIHVPAITSILETKGFECTLL